MQVKSCNAQRFSLKHAGDLFSLKPKHFLIFIVTSNGVFPTFAVSWYYSANVMLTRQVYRVRRELYARLYPTTLVFKDGSTVTIRYPEPRQIIKLPLTLEECGDEKTKLAWQIRRRSQKTGSVDVEMNDITFDASKYLRSRPKKKKD